MEFYGSSFILFLILHPDSFYRKLDLQIVILHLFLYTSPSLISNATERIRNINFTSCHKQHVGHPLFCLSGCPTFHFYAFLFSFELWLFPHHFAALPFFCHSRKLPDSLEDNRLCPPGHLFFALLHAAKQPVFDHADAAGEHIDSQKFIHARIDSAVNALPVMKAFLPDQLFQWVSRSVIPTAILRQRMQRKPVPKPPRRLNLKRRWVRGRSWRVCSDTHLACLGYTVIRHPGWYLFFSVPFTSLPQPSG